MRFENKTYGEERALYGIENAEVIKCAFEGEEDGESALKECRNIKVSDCDFKLRYPFWHVDSAEIEDIRMTETCRAAFWYDSDISVRNSELHGIKALRECQNVEISNCDVTSAEFGWRCRSLSIERTIVRSEYPFFECRDFAAHSLKLEGKYSFQYIENATFRECIFKTKDAFWHAKNVTVYDSLISGEYLGWYSENLRLVRCKISGTQPLCYCKGLVLEDCEMIDTDLSFEKSEVDATVKGNILSVKNPASGRIVADSIGEIVEYRDDCKCVITVGQ